MYRGKTFERGKSFFLRRSRLLKCFVFLDQVLNLVDGVAVLLRLQVRVLDRQKIDRSIIR